MIAALFVATNGPYFGLEGVDPWDELRDARKYSGPFPVVAHPPCQLWGAFAAVNFKRWGGSHNRPANDGGCFASALNSVRKFGGVLEHPAKSFAWNTFGLSKPNARGWKKCGENEWVCEVWQSAYGHKANKKTWLLYVGKNKPADLIWDKIKGSHQIGFYDQRGKSKNKPTISGKIASETPKDFRDILISIARSAL